MKCAPNKALGVTMKPQWEEWELRLIFSRTRIDYDPEKERKNRREKKYSLESAAHLLQRRLLPVPQPPLAVKGPFQEKGEVRYNLMTLDDNTVVLFVVTMRTEETVRILSFRKAHESERAEYWAEAKRVGYSAAQPSAPADIHADASRRYERR